MARGPATSRAGDESAHRCSGCVLRVGDRNDGISGIGVQYCPNCLSRGQSFNRVLGSGPRCGSVHTNVPLRQQGVREVTQCCQVCGGGLSRLGVGIVSIF